MWPVRRSTMTSRNSPTASPLLSTTSSSKGIARRVRRPCTLRRLRACSFVAGMARASCRGWWNRATPRPGVARNRSVSLLFLGFLLDLLARLLDVLAGALHGIARGEREHRQRGEDQDNLLHHAPLI